MRHPSPCRSEHSSRRFIKPARHRPLPRNKVLHACTGIGAGAPYSGLGAGVPVSGPGFRPAAALTRLRLVGSALHAIPGVEGLNSPSGRIAPSRSASLGSSLNGPAPGIPAPSPASKGPYVQGARCRLRWGVRTWPASRGLRRRSRSDRGHFARDGEMRPPESG